MITGDLKNRIDSLWTEFWTGGITNPLTVIEQITFLMYSRLLDMQERKGREARVRYRQAAPQPLSAKDDQDCRWETWRHYGAERCCRMCATACSRTSAAWPSAALAPAASSPNS
jgi:type I restriction enzyme M protein